MEIITSAVSTALTNAALAALSLLAAWAVYYLRLGARKLKAQLKDEAARETLEHALLFKNDDIDLTDIQGELEARAKFIAVPLDRMVENKEISSYEITVLEGHEKTFLEDETMRVKIRYLSRGYIREIEIDLGRAPISA